MNNNYMEVLKEVSINQSAFALFVPSVIATVGYYGMKEEQKRIRKRGILKKLEEGKTKISNLNYNFIVSDIKPKKYKGGQVGEYNVIVE